MIKNIVLVDRNVPMGTDEYCYNKLKETLKQEEQCLQYESIIVIENVHMKDQTSSPLDMEISNSFNISIVAVGYYDYIKTASTNWWCENSVNASTNLKERFVIDDGFLTSIIFDTLDGMLVGENRNKLFEVSCDITECTR